MEKMYCFLNFLLRISFSQTFHFLQIFIAEKATFPSLVFGLSLNECFLFQDASEAICQKAFCSISVRKEKASVRLLCNNNNNKAEKVKKGGEDGISFRGVRSGFNPLVELLYSVGAFFFERK